MAKIDREHFLYELEALKRSPWYNRGRGLTENELKSIAHIEYLARKEAFEVIEWAIKQEPTAEEKVAALVLNEALGDFYNCSNCGTLMRSKTESESKTYSAIKPRVNYCFNCGRRFV